MLLELQEHLFAEVEEHLSGYVPKAAYLPDSVIRPILDKFKTLTSRGAILACSELSHWRQREAHADNLLATLNTIRSRITNTKPSNTSVEMQENEVEPEDEYEPEVASEAQDEPLIFNRKYV
jgi:hypothetical protein